MKHMGLNKMMAMSDEIVANVGYSNKGIASKPSEPKYPYCLRLYLSQQELDMLGMTELPPVGSVMEMEAKVMIVGQRLDDGAKTMELQITDMELSYEMEMEDEESSPEDVLYGKEEKSEA